MITKGEAIELVLLRVTGGELNDESSVQRNDIRVYLPAAINFAMTESYRVNIQVEGNRDISSVFWAYFNDLTITVDATRHNWKYVTLPKGVMPLPRNQGIRNVEDGEGGNFKPLSDNGLKTIKHTLKIFTGAKYFRLDGKKLYLFGMNPNMNNLPGVSMIVDVDDLADTDILPLPAGVEGKALDICFQWVSGQREVPEDIKTDKRDIN